MGKNHYTVRISAGTAAIAFMLVLFQGLAWGTGEPAGVSDIHIRVNETAVVKGPDVLLGEIASIDAPAFLKNGLAAIEIAPSPKPGRMKQVQGKRISNLIEGHALTDETMRIDVPQRIFIKRKSQELETEQLKALVDRYLSEDLELSEYRITEFRIRGLETYPAGDLEVVMDRPKGIGNKGKFSFHTDILVDGVKIDRVNLKGRVAVYKSVLCAVRNLSRGEVVGPSDTALKTVDIFELSGDYLESMDSVDRMALTANIGKGEHLRKSVFKKAPLVRKGDVVKLVARRNRLSIVTLGMCREDGYENQPVMVENMKSGKLVRGFAKNEATVEVMF